MTSFALVRAASVKAGETNFLNGNLFCRAYGIDTTSFDSISIVFKGLEEILGFFAYDLRLFLSDGTFVDVAEGVKVEPPLKRK